MQIVQNLDMNQSVVQLFLPLCLMSLRYHLNLFLFAIMGEVLLCSLVLIKMLF